MSKAKPTGIGSTRCYSAKRRQLGRITPGQYKITEENNMNKTFFTALAISVFGLGMTGCSGSIGFTPANSSAANSANTASNTNSKTTANSNPTKKDDKPKTALKDEKKPTDGNSKKAKNNPVPANWIDIYDEQKGYSFSVPEGTTGGSDTSEGVDVYVATTPAPSEIGVYVLAFKDKTLNKDDLLETAKKFIEEMSEGKATVTMGALKAESEDYSIADATTKQDGKSNKARILVGTDISDNYIMILVCENEEKFSANEKVIDEIWGSFEMWSGGASNN
jgi:hypothetical protein